jgi:hypothetical protein
LITRTSICCCILYTSRTSSAKHTLIRRESVCVTHSHRFISTPSLRLSIPTLPLFTPRTLERIRLRFLLCSGQRLEQVGIFDFLDFLFAFFRGKFLRRRETLATEQATERRKGREGSGRREGKAWGDSEGGLNF